MDTAAAVSFVGRHHRAVLSTRRRDGSPQMSPVVAGVVGGTVVISSRLGLAKVANLQRDPAASLLVMNDAFFGSWVQLDGTAAIVGPAPDPAALELLEETYRSIAGEHPDWADYRRAMTAENRVVIQLRADRASGQLG